MLNTLFGWYARQDLGCKFDNIIFTESVAASTTGYTVTLTNALDGVAKKGKLTGSNFIITDVYSVCTTGIVDVKVLPDNDTSAKFYLQPYQPLSKKLPIPLLLMADIVVVFDNNEAHVNNVYLDFDGFWISEDRMPDFTLSSELIPTSLLDIDMQTFAMLSVLEAMAAAEGLTPPPEGWMGAVPMPEVFREFCKRRGRV